MGIFDFFGPLNVDKMLAKKDVEGLLKALKHEEAYVREKAAESLGKLKDARAAEPLISALKDKETYVVRKVAEALGKIGDARVVEPLIAILDSNYFYEGKIVVAKALGEIRDARAIAALGRMLRSTIISLVTEAAEALGKIGVPAVEELLKSSEESFSGSPIYDDQSRNYETKCHKLKVIKNALENIGAPAVEKLISTLKNETDSYNYSKVVAADVLGRIGDKLAVDSLISVLNSERGDVQDAAKESLDKINPHWSKMEEAKVYVAEFISSLKNKNEISRIGAAKTLGRIGDARAVEPLIEALKDKDWAVRKEAAVALNWLGDARAVEPLILALRDEFEGSDVKVIHRGYQTGFQTKCSYPVVQAAASALVSIGDPRSVLPFIALAMENAWCAQTAISCIYSLFERNASGMETKAQ